jgi:diguanylate cyclase (GGDEF)-like protein/PAS domain S-box-containing protein
MGWRKGMNLKNNHDSLVRADAEIDRPYAWAPSLALVRATIAALLIGALIAVIGLFLVAPEQPQRGLGPLMVAGVALIGWYFLSRGQLHTTITVMAFGIWVVVTGIAIWTDGVSAPVVIAYPLIIMMIGWLVSPRASAITALLTVTVTISMVYARSSGFLPPPPVTPNAMHAIDQSVVYVLCAVLIAILVHAYKSRLRELKSIGLNLVQRTKDLEARTAELHQAQAVGNVGSWLYDIAADAVRLSAETCRIFGLPEGTVVNRTTYLAGIHAEDLDSVMNAWRRALENGVFDQEHRIRVGRATRWVRMRAELELAADGTPVRAVGIAQDITARKDTETALSQSEAELQATLDAVPDYLFEFDLDGRCHKYHAPRLSTLLVAPQSLLGNLVSDVLPADAATVVLSALQQAHDLGHARGSEFLLELPTGGIWFDFSVARKAGLASETPRFIGVARDITQRKQAEVAMRESEERYRAMIEWSPEAIIVHRVGHILYVNPSAVKLFGARSAQDLIGRMTHELIHPDFLESQVSRMKSLIENVAIPPIVESRFLRLDGSAIDVQVQGTAIVYDGGPALHVSIHDITERKAMEDQVRQLAFFDPLTKLPNRRLLNDRLKQTLAANKRSGCYGALLFLDLDNFKALNDTHGHGVGDLLLMEAAARLKNCVREVDTVARLGGDEFVVMLNELNVDRTESTAQAAVIAEIIRATLSEFYALTIIDVHLSEYQIRHHCSASVGVVVFNSDDGSQEDILKWADTAMYKAKVDGGNLVRF